MNSPDSASDTTVLRRIWPRTCQSQERLAKLSGVSRPTIRRLEHGRRRPHKSTVIKLAQALDVEPKELAPDLFVRVGNQTNFRDHSESQIHQYFHVAPHDQDEGPCVCNDGWVTIGQIVVDPETGEEREEFAQYLCRKCAEHN